MSQAEAPATTEAQVPAIDQGQAPAAGELDERLSRHLPRTLTRLDVRILVGLTAVAFLLRLLSPIMPDFLTNPTAWPPVRAWGLGHPYQSPNGYIFDEVYFAQDACKDLVGIDYLDPEPPLSKLFIAAGMVVGGTWLHYDQNAPTGADSPKLKPCESQGTLPGFGTWGWRLTSLVLGTLLIPLIYLLARRLWLDRFFATAAAILMGFDGMSFVQSRIAMIDVVAIFLLLLTCLAFFRHRAARSDREWYVSGIVLGLMIGVSVSAKWITLSAWGTFLVFLVGGAGLRGLRFSIPGTTWTWGGTAVTQPRHGPVEQVWRYLYYVAVFVVLPPIVYFLSWFRYVTYPHSVPKPGGGSFPTTVPAMTLAKVGPVWLPTSFHPVNWFNQIVQHDWWAYDYHHTLTATHTYGSAWYSWPFMLRPVAYYYQDNLGCVAGAVARAAGQTGCVPLRAEVFNLGNPAIWWVAIAAVIYCAVVAVRERSYPAAFIVLAFLAAWVPFSGVSRVLFLYHMFGALPFMMLAVAFMLARLRRLRLHVQVGSLRLPAISGNHLAQAYLGLVLLTFVFFYPLWTGLPISGDSWNQRIWLNIPDSVTKISWI
ncbi:MAG TPA: phospholipid carrier-dependent glycosyltransferase [Candidatus Dormibacteraeota bacterium]|jgi:dolichyl-phosphate-mannose--protein O-mannosyl transferase|nr:phospholipid carrier-dependent glycosyltransferase [Candidatus Dormibacteraeota bacterium]